MTVWRDQAPPTVAHLCDAFATDDASALLASLSPDFRGVVSDGMPFGVGGTHEGPRRMVDSVWVVVSGLADVTPVPEEYLDAGDGRGVVGRYRGRVLATGAEIDAAFVHLLRLDEGRITELVQVTDTARWHAASGPTRTS